VGDETWSFAGSRLRIRRQSIRRLGAFRGHCWMSALFPSGRASGCRIYPPGTDGKTTYNNGFIFEGDGELVPARVIEAPWLRRLQSHGEDVSVVLETSKGRTRIEGKTFVSTFDIYHKDKGFSIDETKQENPNFPALHQAGVHYHWEREETYGMIERSAFLSKITLDGKTGE